MLLGSHLVSTGADVVVTRYLEPRLTRTRLNSAEAPSTVPLGVELATAGTVVLRAPWDAELTEDDDVVVLRRSDGVALRVSGEVSVLREAGRVAAGDAFARLDTDGPLARARIQATTGISQAPFFVAAGLAEAWSRVCPDPSPLLGVQLKSNQTDDSGSPLLGRRDAAFAPVQEHYYATPPQIERGWRVHLYDVEGRSYLDKVNNVSVVGRGHPRLAAAASSQWHRLNTNSRFHYRSVVDFSERLAALVPDPLDTVFLVNSGSEAVDLAIRLAWANTARRDIVALREAYRGWTVASDAVSTSVADNPDAIETRPAAVREWSSRSWPLSAARRRKRGPHQRRQGDDHHSTRSVVLRLGDLVRHNPRQQD